MIEYENNKNRVFWKMGRVEGLLKGDDNVVQGATLQLANQNIIQRPIQKLYPFEVNCDMFQIVNGPKDSKKMDEEPIPTRAHRRAAALAKKRLTIIDQLEKDELC